jgi:hypothetical protein
MENKDLEKAQKIYNVLQEDIQKYLTEEYIMPELKGDDLIKKFDLLIETTECQRLEWSVLVDLVGKIIGHSGALSQMCEINTLGFKNSYEQHFIEKKNAFILFDSPLESMCAELVMKKWH